jgi:hypothetical protein
MVQANNHSLTLLPPDLAMTRYAIWGASPSCRELSLAILVAQSGQGEAAPMSALNGTPNGRQIPSISEQGHGACEPLPSGWVIADISVEDAWRKELSSRFVPIRGLLGNSRAWHGVWTLRWLPPALLIQTHILICNRFLSSSLAHYSPECRIFFKRRDTEARHHLFPRNKGGIPVRRKGIKCGERTITIGVAPCGKLFIG